MKITVILCTFNRCERLEKALESVAHSTVPDPVEWEVLVVDNNSTDQTPAVVKGFCQRYPGRFRYLFEPHPGKSRALNAGVRDARGSVLAFTDDDVVVEPTWLQNLTMPLTQGECVGIAGRILPEQGFSPPRWIPLADRDALAPLAIFNPDREAGPLNTSPYGANMAFQRSVFEKYGGFRTDLGPEPGSGNPQKSEDSEFGQRLLAAGEPLRYEPAAVVYHAVTPNRIQKKYFLAWWFDKSRADIRAFGIPTDTKWFVARIPLYLFRRLAVWTLRWMVAVEPSRRFSFKVRVWSYAGQIVESYNLSREINGSRGRGANR
ncbi:MAG: glycosyltransferase family 2 protein [Candidatus Acidiferrales bacterium]